MDFLDLVLIISKVEFMNERMSFRIKMMFNLEKEIKAKVECISVRGKLLIQTPPDKR